MLQVGLTIYVAVGQVEMLSRDLKKIGDDGFLPTAKLWHNVLLAKFAGAMFAENVACGSRRYETLCIELYEAPGCPRSRLTQKSLERLSVSLDSAACIFP
jgi:hypothetical protein